jgi:drug/metabolite transporter (DMT)-like permease
VAALTVLLALLAALTNGSATVLQRLAAVEQNEACGGKRGGLRLLLATLRRPAWLAGAAAVLVSALCQAAALSVGELSLVQPLLTSELLFTLVVGSLVFRHRPARTTWLSFLALALGLALFLVAAEPSAGGGKASGLRWFGAGCCVVLAVLALVALARVVRGPARAAALGAATAVCFAFTAALMKEATQRVPDGLAAVFSTWQLYGMAVFGLSAVLLLQSALHAGSLAASQPALTLGDALVSIALGWALYGERIALGVRMVPEALGVLLIAAGTLGLSRSPAITAAWDTEPADAVRGRPPRSLR